MPLLEQSFMKALFHGVIAEDMIFPYPEMPGDDRDNTSLILDSINALDRPVVVAYLMVVVLIFVTLNLVVDLLYTLIDPRVGLET